MTNVYCPVRFIRYRGGLAWEMRSGQGRIRVPIQIMSHDSRRVLLVAGLNRYGRREGRWVALVELLRITRWGGGGDYLLRLRRRSDTRLRRGFFNGRRAQCRLTSRFLLRVNREHRLLEVKTGPTRRRDD